MPLDPITPEETKRIIASAERLKKVSKRVSIGKPGAKLPDPSKDATQSTRR